MELLFLPLHRDWENHYAALDIEDLSIYRISAETKEKIKSIYGNEESTLDQTAAERLTVKGVPALEEVYKLLGKPVNVSESTVLNQAIGGQQEAETGVVNGTKAHGCEKLDTLILHISNSCNLKCGYCFAGHGSYQSKPGLMEVQTAIQTLEVFFKRYSYIREVKLFGGEPLLNPDVMEAVGKYIRAYKGHQPEIKVITNGTILTERIKQIIRDYGIKVVFSIDGNAIVHDTGRFYPDGKGTFETVYQNFMELRSFIGDKQPYSIDVTYSGVHEKAGMTVNDVVWYLTDTFGVKPSKVNVSLISVEEDSEYALNSPERMIESAKEALERAYEGDNRTHMKLKAVIRRLKNRMCADNSICSACRSWIAVSYTGKVYPCLMFMDREEYEMGHIAPELFETAQYDRIYNQFQGYRKQEHSPCAECFARKACSVCVGINEFYTGSLYCSSAIQCHEIQEIVKIVIEGIAEGIW